MNAYQRAAFAVWLWECQLAYAFHITRLHRRQGVWGVIHLVCTVQPGTRTPILTTYNQSRQNAHRG
jgi:hypothetical protein